MSQQLQQLASQDHEQVVLTIEEAGRLLRISRGLAYEMARQGSIPTIKLGRRMLVPRAALDRLLGTGTGAVI